MRLMTDAPQQSPCKGSWKPAGFIGAGFNLTFDTGSCSFNETKFLSEQGGGTGINWVPVACRALSAAEGSSPCTTTLPLVAVGQPL